MCWGCRAGTAWVACTLRKLQASETLRNSPAVRSGAPDRVKARTGLAEASGFTHVMFANEPHFCILLLFVIKFYTMTWGLLTVFPSRQGSDLQDLVCDRL